MAAAPTATITDLRLEGQSIACTITVTGDPGGTAAAWMVVYDAAGSERERTGLGEMSVGQTWEAVLDLPAATLGDGDYGVWIQVSTESAGGEYGHAEQGISFLVGRGRVYPSSEAVDTRAFTTPPTISGLRLEGSWVVFNMTSNEKHDVEVIHQLLIGRTDMDDQQTFHGEELLRAGATQQGHYLLPESLPDGQYYIGVTVQNEGSDYVMPELINIQVDGGVITPVPAT